MEPGDRELQPTTPPKVESRPFYRLLKGSTGRSCKTGLLPATSTGGCEQRLCGGDSPYSIPASFRSLKTSAALPSHPPLPPAPLMAGPSSQVRRPPQDSPIHTFSPAGDSSYFLSTHLALVWSIHPLRSAQCKHAGTAFDFTDDTQWKLSTQASHWGSPQSGAWPWRHTRHGPPHSPSSGLFLHLRYAGPYFSASKLAALLSPDHLSDVYLSPLSSTLLRPQRGHVQGHGPANPPAPVAGLGSPYHQLLASHSLPLLATYVYRSTQLSQRVDKEHLL